MGRAGKLGRSPAKTAHMYLARTDPLYPPPKYMGISTGFARRTPATRRRPRTSGPGRSRRYDRRYPPFQHRCRLMGRGVCSRKLVGRVWRPGQRRRMANPKSPIRSARPPCGVRRSGGFRAALAYAYPSSSVLSRGNFGSFAPQPKIHPPKEPLTRAVAPWR